LYKRLPKFGFNRTDLQKPLKTLSLARLQLFIDQGRIDASRKITMHDIAKSGVVGKVKHGVKLLANVSARLLVSGALGAMPRAQGADEFRHKVDIEVSQASQAAIACVEAQGGSLRSVFFGDVALRHHLHPEKTEKRGHLVPKNPRPPLKKIDYYLSWKNRGYLSRQAQLLEAQHGGDERA
jgi:large subunit ribosomal protein L15